MVAVALIVAIVFAWIACGITGALTIMAFDHKLPNFGTLRSELSTMAGRFYVGILAIFGPLAIIMAMGSALGYVLFSERRAA